jgi:broad specificity phosphatase PhoE
LFRRPYRSKFNDKNIFLGQKEDPDIIRKDTIKNNDKITEADIILSSPSRRCINTLKMITDKKIIIDDRLKEINYGDVDGKDIKYLSENFPKIVEQWDLGLDPRFPNGENYLGVIKRLKLFINDIQKNLNKKIVVCTHNVVIRAMIGLSLKIHYTKWHKINIPYAEPIKFILTKDNRFYIESYPEQTEIILKNL